MATSTIPTIDAWNLRINPRQAAAGDLSGSDLPEDTDCGCCPQPKCCPPQLICRRLATDADFVGFTKPDSGSDSSEDPEKPTLYLKRETTNVFHSPPDAVVHYDGNPANPTYTSQVNSGTKTSSFGGEYSQGWSAFIGSLAGGTCRSSEATLDDTCSVTGSWLIKGYSEYFEDGSWHNFLSNDDEWMIEDAEGLETEAHASWAVDAAAWDMAHPDYPAELAAYEAALAAYNACEAMTPGECGDEPVAPEPRPTEPSPAVYPKCWYKYTETVTSYRLNTDTTPYSVEMVPSTDEAPNPSVQVFYFQIGFGPGPSGTADPAMTVYSEPKTWDAAFDEADAWLTSNIDEAFTSIDGSGSDDCEADDSCSAGKSYTSLGFRGSAVQYQWRLNKCCGTYSALSWLEVFYSQAFLDWLDSLTGGSSDPEAPDTPTSVAKAWEWTGTRDDAACDASDDPSDSTDDLDPFDADDHWSPWSATMRITGIFQGLKTIRSLYMVCWRSSRYGTKPDYIPLAENRPIGQFDPSDLDNDGEPD